MKELRRFSRHRLTRAALVVLTMIPLLYGALYLAAFWDPYGNLKHIPVALVVQDTPVSTSDGETVHIGQDLARALIDRQVFGWTPASQEEAERGLADGTYHLMLRIPPDFSRRLADAPDPSRQARASALIVESDDATNYLSGLLARSAFTEIRAAASAGTAARYFDRMLLGFTDLKAETAKAAEGAAQLAQGAGQARDGAGRLADGTASAASGADTLAAGLASANAGAAELARGLDTLEAGSAQLADGAAQAAAGGQRLASVVDSASEKLEPKLREYQDEIQTAATLIADGADAIAQHVDEFGTIADQAVARTGAVVSTLDALAAAHPSLPDDPAFVAARAGAVKANETAVALRAKLSGLDDLAARLHTVAADARAVAAAAPHLADDVAHARQEVDRLAAGLTALSQGAEQLHLGTRQAAQGAHALDGGLYRLSSGARQLDGGLGALSHGARSLADGLTTLDSGAQRLADGLADGAEKIPGYDPDDRADRAGVLGDPVALNRTVKHAAATYGVGFAPYFLALALWVGAMLSYMLLRPLTRRHVVSGAPGRRVAFAGYAPAAAIGVAQALVLFGVVRFGLGLRPVSSWGTLGLLVLSALAFTAIVQMLGAVLGPAGRLAALILLMLQLTSSGGTYPVQTSPAFFQAIHDWLPMTYVIAGLRRLTVGGSLDAVWWAVAALLGFACLAFALTALKARRSRRLTTRDLHPVLTM
jgi:putative membrane protein